MAKTTITIEVDVCCVEGCDRPEEKFGGRKMCSEHTLRWIESPEWKAMMAESNRQLELFQRRMAEQLATAPLPLSAAEG